MVAQVPQSEVGAVEQMKEEMVQVPGNCQLQSKMGQSTVIEHYNTSVRAATMIN